MSIVQRLQRTYRAWVGTEQQPACQASKPPPAEPPKLKEGQIDVRDLIARYDAARHAELADAYFEPRLNNLVLRRKPFITTYETVQILTAFAHVVDALRIYPQVRILDFGAGTAWSSRFLASLGCRVTAMDVSKHALQIGRTIHQEDPTTRDLPIDFRVFDGRSIPVADKSFDRILSFDAFHHVADQKAVLAEFSRVLADDGVAAFAEPGPYHSLMPSSQIEMQAYDVIENDIRVEEIWATARACGFEDIKLSFAMPHQTLVSLDDFNRFLEQRSAPDDVVFSRLNSDVHLNRRVFFLYKSATNEPDSRFISGLNYSMELIGAPTVEPNAIGVRLVLQNTGGATWLPSGYEPGNVNVGVHLRSADGRMLDHDFTRVSVSSERVKLGQKVEISGTIPWPDVDDFNLELDLVAEAVIWFEIVGGQPMKLPFRKRAYVGSQ
jgi:SAM-dependent methyltransferase